MSPLRGWRCCATCEWNPMQPRTNDNAGKWCCVPFQGHSSPLGNIRCYDSHGWRPRLVTPRPPLVGYAIRGG